MLDSSEILSVVIGAAGSGMLYVIKNLKMKWKSQAAVLTEHEIFTQLRIAKLELNQVSISCNQEVWREMLLVKYEVWASTLFNHLRSIKDTKLKNHEITALFVEWGTEAIAEYEKTWKDMGVPEICKKMFNQFHRDKVDQFFDAATHKPESYLYFTKEQKISAILDELRILLVNTKADLLRLLRYNWNGELVGATYRGIPIKDSEYLLYCQNKQ